jgi:Fe-S cluster assembly iron-binding protein IscA
MVTLTERAAEHVLALMREDPEAFALRVAVQGGTASRSSSIASASRT